MLTAFWPQRWSRQQRSNATLVSAVILMVLALALLGQLLSFLPEPIGSNAQAFSDGARTTLWLTLISGSVGLVLGTGAALARTARWAVVRWAASFYIWVIRGTPLLVQIVFLYTALAAGGRALIRGSMGLGCGCGSNHQQFSAQAARTLEGFEDGNQRRWGSPHLVDCIHNFLQINPRLEQEHGVLGLSLVGHGHACVLWT